MCYIYRDFPIPWEQGEGPQVRITCLIANPQARVWEPTQPSRVESSNSKMVIFLLAIPSPKMRKLHLSCVWGEEREMSRESVIFPTLLPWSFLFSKWERGREETREMEKMNKMAKVIEDGSIYRWEVPSLQGFSPKIREGEEIIGFEREMAISCI